MVNRLGLGSEVSVDLYLFLSVCMWSIGGGEDSCIKRRGVVLY